MNTERDPAVMLEDDRLVELSDILAVGYLRLLRSRRNPLDQGRSPAALHGVLNGRGDAPRKETA